MDTCISSPVHLEINNQILEQSIAIYPNPSSGIFEVETSAFFIDEISIFSQEGKIVFAESFHKQQKSAAINMTNIDNGIYFLEIKTEQGIIRKKIEVINN